MGKGRWILSLVILAIVFLAVVGYVYFVSDIRERDFDNIDTPSTISNYKLTEVKNMGKDCYKEYNWGQEIELCRRTMRAEYDYNNSGSGEVVLVSFSNVALLRPSEKITRYSLKKYLDRIHSLNVRDELSEGVYVAYSDSVLQWYPDEYDVISVDQYISENGILINASIDHPVTSYYLKKYPPKKFLS